MEAKINSQPIRTIQLHIYPSHLFTFHNTIYIECFKQFAKGIVVKVVQHKHPLHHESELPFAIVNATHVITKPNLKNLLDAISGQKPIRTIQLKPIFQLCEQISAVGRIVSLQSRNPYYLMLSPMKKYEIYKWNNNFKKQIYETTQYFNLYTQQLNKQHLIYKIDTLADYVRSIEKTKIVIICVYSMIKSLKVDNQVLYEMAIKNQVLKRCEEEGTALINQVIGQQINQMNQIRFIATLTNQVPKQKEEQKKQVVFANSYLQFISHLALPIIGFGIFWKAHKTLSSIKS